jgi:chromosome partitioning protein
MISAADLEKLVVNAHNIHRSVRAEMLKPHPRKMAPLFTAAAIAKIAGVEKSKIDSRLRLADLPQGEIRDGKRRRLWTLADARSIIATVENRPARPPGTPGAVISLVNFKGGSTKTSTTFNLAQGLALRGRKVLLVDLDPQGSASVLAGLMPATELEEANTVAPLFQVEAADALTDLDYAIQETYWAGLDIVPGAPPLQAVEMIVPSMSAKHIEWWNILNVALAKHREHYDYIIVDTAPSLSYLAVCAIYASDSLIMPLPPEQLDFSASIAFWDSVWQTTASLEELKGVRLNLKMIGVLLSRVKATAVTPMMRRFIGAAYAQYMMNVEIPASDANVIGGVNFGTVHDSVDEDGVSRGDSKLRAAFDELIERIEQDTLAFNWGGKTA